KRDQSLLLLIDWAAFLIEPKSFREHDLKEFDQNTRHKDDAYARDDSRRIIVDPRRNTLEIRQAERSGKYIHRCIQAPLAQRQQPRGAFPVVLEFPHTQITIPGISNDFQKNTRGKSQQPGQDNQRKDSHRETKYAIVWLRQEEETCDEPNH